MMHIIENHYRVEEKKTNSNLEKKTTEALICDTPSNIGHLFMTMSK